jgi:hypothetical protein
MLDNLKFWKKKNDAGVIIHDIVDKSAEDEGTSYTDVQEDPGVSTLAVPGATSLQNYLLAPVNTNKGLRLREYRMMANHVEVSDAIDEVCDSIFNKTDEGKFAKLILSGPVKKSSAKKSVLAVEFDHILSLFNFQENGFSYARRFVIEGELAFENIINPKQSNKGILRVSLLDNEKYELLKDLKTSELVGILLDVSKQDINSQLSPSFRDGLEHFNSIDAYGGSYGSFKKESYVPLLFSQITYVNTGVFDANRTFVYPPLDNARQAYKQLVLIEDGVIIYRVARSPERLVFNVSSGNTAGPKAQQQLFQMMKRFNTRKKTKKKSGSSTGRDVDNTYDAHQVVESYWFLKPEDSQGSSVESIGGQANFGELEDLKFFTRKLYRSLKVPFSRFEQPENTISQGEDITAEEFKFAKFIVRLQACFAHALCETFKTHLKLKGIWEKYNLSNRDVQVLLQSPAMYELYKVAKLNQMRMEAYESIADSEDFSSTIAMRKILDWSDDEIKENNESIFMEEMRKSEIEYWKDKVEEYGSYDKAKKAVESEESD